MGVTKINKNLYRAALAKAGYTQEQLAKALGIAESTLIRKVKNDAITMDEANKIIGILKIDDPSSVFFYQNGNLISYLCKKRLMKEE